MVTRVEMVLVDDLNPQTEADETVRFALDGTSYEIDLTAAHAAELRAAFNGYIGAARQLGRGNVAQPRHISCGCDVGGDAYGREASVRIIGICEE